MSATLLRTYPRDSWDMSKYYLNRRQWRVDWNGRKWSVGVDWKRFDGWFLLLVRPLPCIEIVVHSKVTPQPSWWDDYKIVQDRSTVSDGRASRAALDSEEG